MDLRGGAQEHYDMNLQPTGGAGTGGQSMGTLGLYALLAHGAKANIREMQTYKSEGRDPQTDPSKRWPSDHDKVWAAMRFAISSSCSGASSVNPSRNKSHSAMVSCGTRASCRQQPSHPFPHSQSVRSVRMDCTRSSMSI